MRNAAKLTVPASRFSKAILEAMVRTRYIDRIASGEENGRPVIEITLRYVNGTNAIQAIKQLSHRGLRRYSDYRSLRAPRRGGGIMLLSTPLGVLSNAEARKRGVGGELLCEIHS